MPPKKVQSKAGGRKGKNKQNDLTGMQVRDLRFTAPATSTVSFSRSRQKPTVVVKTERLAPALFPAELGPLSFAWQVTPGSSETFPYLSTIASKFAKYRFKKIKFTYSPIVPTSTAGNLSIAFDYESSFNKVKTSADLAQFSNYVSGPIWSPIEINIECDSLWRFTSDVESNVELYQLGSLAICTEGYAGGSAFGYMTCAYTCEFCCSVSEATNVNSQLTISDFISTDQVHLALSASGGTGPTNSVYPLFFSNQTQGADATWLIFRKSSSANIGGIGLAQGRYSLSFQIGYAENDILSGTNMLLAAGLFGGSIDNPIETTFLPFANGISFERVQPTNADGSHSSVDLRISVMIDVGEPETDNNGYAWYFPAIYAVSAVTLSDVLPVQLDSNQTFMLRVFKL